MIINDDETRLTISAEMTRNEVEMKVAKLLEPERQLLP